jgi:hypothetical protein
MENQPARSKIGYEKARPEAHVMQAFGKNRTLKKPNALQPVCFNLL